MPALSLRRAFTAVLFSAIVVLPLATSPALARMKRPGGDSVSLECWRVQNESDALRAEYKNEATSNARREDILTELRGLGSYWIAAGCRTLYGDISKFSIKLAPERVMPLPPKSLVDSGGSDSERSEPTDVVPTDGTLY